MVHSDAVWFETMFLKL